MDTWPFRFVVLSLPHGDSCPISLGKAKAVGWGAVLALPAVHRVDYATVLVTVVCPHIHLHKGGVGEFTEEAPREQNVSPVGLLPDHHETDGRFPVAHQAMRVNETIPRIPELKADPGD